MINTYSEAVAYLYQNLPMFQRVGAVALKPDLTNTLRLCKVLGNPQGKFKSVHVAGTNGKGSTSHMLASVLQSAGYKTGLYTSPHLKAFTERIKINGAEISQAFVVDFVNRILPVVEEVKPSFFEITVAMAFDYFVREKVDVAVIEVGLGGRLDSTNVITPEVSVITNIGWDHKEILGDTLEKIASEKAGIIKKNVPVVISERQAGIEQVFTTKAREMSAPVRFASDQYRAVLQGENFYVTKDQRAYIEDLKMPLGGIYQQHNLPGVLGTIDVLTGAGFQLGEKAVRHGLENVVQQTGLKGRWQKLKNKPLVICDTGHNEDGVRQVMKQISDQRFRRLHIVWGMVRDKDISVILELLPRHATYYFCQAAIPRAMEAGTLAQQAMAYGLVGEVIPEVNQAYQQALRQAAEDDLIFIGGSTFVVAELEGL